MKADLRRSRRRTSPRCSEGDGAILERMEYEHVDGPDGLDIRVPTSDDHRTCAVCRSDCEPDPSLSVDGAGVRVAFVCPQHGVQSVVDPFEGMR